MIKGSILQRQGQGNAWTFSVLLALQIQLILPRTTPGSLWKNHNLESNLGGWNFQRPTSKSLDVMLPLKPHICIGGGVVHAQHIR